MVILMFLIALWPFWWILGILIYRRIKTGYFFPAFHQEHPPLTIGAIVSTYGINSPKGTVLAFENDPPGDGDVVVEWEDGEIMNCDAGALKVLSDTSEALDDKKAPQ